MHPVHPPRPCPPRPAPPCGILVQKIIACEKRQLPCAEAEWCFHSCASGAIQSVAASGAPTWVMAAGCRLRITIPISVRLCDACGRCANQPASLEVELTLPHAFVGAMDDPRNALLILPCIRLLRASRTCGECFRVQLAVSLELYLLRYEALQGGSFTPPCPPLPLYPQPLC